MIVPHGSTIHDRKKRLRANSFVLLAALSFAGYPLLGAITTATTGYSSTASMLLRIGTATLAVLLLVVPQARRADSIAFYLLRLFWIVYGIRLLYDTLLSQSFLSHPPSYYLMWGFGACGLPALALSRWHLTASHSRTLMLLIMGMLAMALPLVYLATFDTMVGMRSAGADVSRLRTEWMNPIMLGHFALSLTTLVAIWLANSRSKALFLPGLAGCVFGLILLAAANSRGPIVAAAAMVLAMTVVGRGAAKSASALLMLVAAVAGIPFLQLVQDYTGTDIFGRIGSSAFIQDDSRALLINLAMQGFAASPWFGWGLEVPTIGAYPHNLFVEAFLALGVFGVVFVALALSSLALAVRMLRDRDQLWIGLLFIQYFVAAQFSGSLVTSVLFWTLQGLVLAAHSTKPRRTSFPTSGENAAHLAGPPSVRPFYR